MYIYTLIHRCLVATILFIIWKVEHFILIIVMMIIVITIIDKYSGEPRTTQTYKTDTRTQCGHHLSFVVIHLQFHAKV